MQVRLLAFAHTRDVLGFSELMVECAAAESPRAILFRVAPSLNLPSIRVAVDYEYHDLDAPIGTAREIALIPPVSGG